MDHFCNLVAGIFPYFCIEQMIKEYGSYLSALCAYTYSCRSWWHTHDQQERIFDPFVFTSRWRSYTRYLQLPSG